MSTCWGHRVRTRLVLDFVVGRNALLEYNLGMDCPNAPCGGYAKCCHVVDPGGGCQSIGDCQNIGILDYDRILDTVSSCNPDGGARDLGDRDRVRLFGAMVRVVLSFISIWILPVAACRISGVCRVVV